MNYKIKTKNELENFISHNYNEVNSYIDEKQKNLPCLFYASVDIRESKTKFAPVDLNIYPAGFNNLCTMDLGISSEQFKKMIHKINPETKKVGIFTESHTKNKFYLDHLFSLSSAINNAGFEVKLFSIDQELFEGSSKLELESQSGHKILLYKAEIKNNAFEVDGTKFDFVIMNNDQSKPFDVDWNKMTTKIHPTPKIGWFVRQKVTHFQYYNQIVKEFCEHFEIDPTLIEAKFKAVHDVDFATKEGIEKLASEVDELKKELPPETVIFVKASQGTYGMGISVVQNGEEILNMNRKTRNKMDIGKNNIKFTSILVQEGIETVLKYDGAPAEVTIYLIGGRNIGGFLRTNAERTSLSNLNAKGMIYQKLCIAEIKEHSDHKVKEAVYSVIARLSSLAGSMEIKEVL